MTDDKTPISPFAGVTIGDVDGPAQTQTLTVSAAFGSFTHLGAGSFGWWLDWNRVGNQSLARGRSSTLVVGGAFVGRTEISDRG